MGIFEAEKRRLFNAEENRVTSAVFGALEIIDRSTFLAPVLKKCSVDLRDKLNLDRLIFNYWESMDESIPDVTLRDREDKSILISIECKLGCLASEDKEQLENEYKDGAKKHKDFWLVVVTRDFERPDPIIDEAKRELRKEGYGSPRIEWISWQNIYAILHKNRERETRTERELIRDLLLLMENKGLMVFDGFEQEQLTAAADLAHEWGKLYKFSQQCDALFEDVKARLSREKESFICFPYAPLQLGYTKDTSGEISNWTGIEVWDKSWSGVDNANERGSKGSSLQKLIAQLHLNSRDSNNPLELIAGYQLDFNLKSAQSLRTDFSKEAKSHGLASQLAKTRYLVMFYYDVDWDMVRRVEASNLNDDSLFSQTFNDATGIIFGRAFGQKELASSDLADGIVDCLVDMRRVIKENNLYFSGYPG